MRRDIFARMGRGLGDPIPTKGQILWYTKIPLRTRLLKDTLAQGPFLEYGSISLFRQLAQANFTYRTEGIKSWRKVRTVAILVV
jgi:hypothetical protein